MFRLRDPKDNRVHISLAKAMAISPAHAKARCLEPWEATPAMVFGSLVDALCLDVGKRRVRVFEGSQRRGKEWDAFVADCPPDALICKREEHDRALKVAAAVLADPNAGPLLSQGEHQRVIQWEMHGLPWAAGIAGQRGGFDVLGPGYIADLKTTTCTEPITWSRHARRMLYVEQLAAYKAGAEYIGHKVDHCYLVGVETRPPFAVTVLRLTDEDIADGQRTIAAWCERIRACEASDHWPAYAQRIVDLEPKAAWEMVDDAASE